MPVEGSIDVYRFRSVSLRRDSQGAFEFDIDVSQRSKMDIIKSLSKLQSKLVPFISNYNQYCVYWTTLHYLWTVHKCGIMVIKSNQSIEVLPFCNDRFDNRLSWPKQGLLFQIDGAQVNSVEDYYALKRSKYGIQESRLGIHKDVTKWWLNGHLVCNTLDEWSSRGLIEIKHNISLILQGQKDCVVFVNRRDFPLHSKLGSSFSDAFGHCPEVPMFHGRALSTILSFYGSESYNDRLWPPVEHWTLNVPLVPKTILKAVFRGTLTGSFDVQNPRLYLARLNDPNINAGLTAWSHRDRIRDGIVQYYGPSVFLSQSLSIEEQCKYAIIVYAHGHVSSSRLAWNLLSGSLVICIDSECTAPLQWLHKISVDGSALTDGVHYVKSTAFDVQKVVAKYLADQTSRERIGLAGREWCLKALNRNFMIEYCRSLL